MWLGCVCACILVGTGVLVARALHGAAQAELMQHQVVADRIFDELEEELSDLISREEARSFLEYRFFYVPALASTANPSTLVQSPLASPPQDSAVIGYFQLDPDGTLHLPSAPRSNEIDLARAGGWSGDDEVAVTRERLKALVRGSPAAPPEPAPVPEPAQVAQSQKYVAQSLNRGLKKRQARVSKQVQTVHNAVAGFEDNYGNIADVVQQDIAVQGGSGEVDVLVSPIAGELRGTGELLLSRTVRIGANAHRQGLVLSTTALAADLEAAVLGGSEVRDHVVLEWAPGGIGIGDPAWVRYAFPHRFAAPFEDWSVVAHVAAIPEHTGREPLAIVLLAALMALITLAGGWALWRMVVTELDFARRRSDFVAAVSHELKTPLTAIRMHAEMLREGMVPDEDRRQEYYRILTSEAERLSRLIQNVLELARLERGVRGQVEVGRLGPVLQEVADVLGAHVRAQGFSLEVREPDELPAVLLDRDALAQVLVNLVDNALKFAGDATDRVVLIEASVEGEEVVVRVRDRGPGVPAAQLERVFEPFFRGERELTRRTKGTGIGLALVRGLVGRMGGSVSARNHPGGGFEVDVRLARAGAAA